ncbi:MAG: tRNA (adenosine(37)-N6)-dimethylallyltransferase MiaA [Planctomycetota bacterium]
MPTPADPTPPDARPRPVVLLGPTAGGKSELAAALAERLGGPVIGADSMQVYRHLDAGTAKPPPELRKRVRHHLIDVVEPTQRFTVHDWLRQAEAAIRDALDAGRTPVVVGGTNLYLKALLGGLFDGPGRDAAFRATLQDVPGPELHARLAAVDPDAADRIAPADRPRLTRALEVFHMTGRPISDWQVQWGKPVSGEWGAMSGEIRRPGSPHSPTPTHHSLLLGLRWPAEAINPRINLRVRAMFHPEKVDPALAAAVCPRGESLPAEVRRLVAEGRLLPGAQACAALGYKQVLGVLFPERFPELIDPRLRTLDDAYERTKVLTRRFAKQQRTWLKRFAGVRWIEMPHADPTGDALRWLAAENE